MRRMRAIVLLAIVALTLVGAIGFSLVSVVPAVGTEEDKGILAGLISRALSSPGMQVSIGAVDGALSSNATIRDIVIADAQGPWLKLDQAHIQWTRSALFARRLEIDRLEIGKLEFLRRPIASGAPTADTGGPVLPELPVKVVVGHFALDQLVLGESLAGVAARLSAQGQATLGDPSEGLDLGFDARRLDAPGSLAIRLGFVPKSKDLSLQLSANEPAGGIVAHLASLPGLPPVALDLNGSGPLDQFAAKLAFSAGPDMGADGSLNLVREGVARRLTLDLAARVAALLPPGVAPLFAGSTSLVGAILLGDDGSVGFNNFALTARTERLDVTGGIGADRNLDLHIAAHALPAAQSASDLPGAARQFDLDVAATGTIEAPHLDGRLAVADLVIPAGRFGRFDAHFAATPSGRLLDAATHIDFSGEAQGSEWAFADAKWAAAIGDTMTASLNGALAPSGEVDLTARLDMSGATLSYVGKIGERSLAGKLQASVVDLGRFSALAGTKLRGRAALSADLDGVPQQGAIGATLAGSLDDVVTNYPAVDGLAGSHVSLEGQAKKTADGFAFSGLQLAGSHFTARLDGTAAKADSDITAAVDIPNLKYADSRLTGAGDLAVQVKGPIDHSTADAQLTLTGASALGRAIPRLVVQANIADPFDMPQAKATIDGEIGGKAARGEIDLAALPGGGWRLDPSQVTLGSASLSGAATIDASRLASGHLSFAADDLDDVSALALRKLAGRMTADVDLGSNAGKQSLVIAAQASGVRAGGSVLDHLDAKMRLDDMFGAPAANGTLAVDRLALGGLSIGHLRADAKPSSQGTNLNVEGDAQGLAVRGSGTLSATAPMRLDLGVLDLRRGKDAIALVAPASLRFVDGGIATDGIGLSAGGGRLDLKGKAGNALDLTIALHNLPLALASLFQPKLALAGTLDGDARIAGTPAAPSGDWRLKIARLVAQQSRSAGLPSLDVTAAGRIAGNATTLDATLSAGSAGTLHMTGSAPISGTGSLDLSAKGAVDAALANNVLAASGRKVTGKMVLDARATGTLAAPQLSGSLSLADASFSDPTLGLKLADVSAQITGRGDNVEVERFSATTPNAGSLSASGSVSVKPGAGFPGHFTITGRHAQIAANDLVAATADLDLTLTGALAERPHIDGTVTLQSMDINVPDRLPITLRPLPGTQHIAPGTTAALRLALEKKDAAAHRAPLPFDPDLALKISAPSRVFVRGRGINAEFGGELQLAGSLAKPAANGAFDLRSGQLNLLAQRLDLSRGRLTFAGDLVPELDFLAEAQADDITAQVAVTGEASAPAFAITSTPSLPQDEVLSRLIFRKPAGGLSPVQAIQLAQIVAELSGSSSGLDVFEKMRKTLGVDSFDVQTDAQGKAQVGASRYISNNVNVGVRTGVTPQTSGVTVGVDITKRLRAQGAVGMDGSSSLGVGMEWEY